MSQYDVKSMYRKKNKRKLDEESDDDFEDDGPGVVYECPNPGCSYSAEGSSSDQDQDPAAVDQPRKTHYAYWFPFRVRIFNLLSYICLSRFTCMRMHTFLSRAFSGAHVYVHLV